MWACFETFIDLKNYTRTSCITIIKQHCYYMLDNMPLCFRFILDNVHAGMIIYSYQYLSYRILENDLKKEHCSVNYSVDFIDPLQEFKRF